MCTGDHGVPHRVRAQVSGSQRYNRKHFKKSTSMHIPVRHTKRKYVQYSLDYSSTLVSAHTWIAYIPSASPPSEPDTMWAKINGRSDGISSRRSGSRPVVADEASVSATATRATTIRDILGIPMLRPPAMSLLPTHEIQRRMRQKGQTCRCGRYPNRTWRIPFRG